MKALGPVLLLVLAGCGDAPSGDAAGSADAGAVAAEASESAPSESTFVVAPWHGDLTDNPKAGPVDPYCNGYPVTPKTVAGRLVVAHGWIVTGEVPLGGLRAVSFVEELRPGMSGLCLAIGGRVGVFEGRRPQAMVSRESEDVLAAIGYVEAVPNSSSVRIWDSGLGYSSPLADLTAEEPGVRVDDVAEVDLICAPAVELPTTFGMTIQEARKRMIEGGWKPTDHRRDVDYQHIIPERLRADGIIEAENCAGTGLGPCNFDYQGPSGVSVRLHSAGEQFAIRAYSYSCRTSAPKLGAGD